MIIQWDKKFGFISWEDLGWSSDWDGEDIGEDDVNIVGLYMLKGSDFGFYINMETDEVLEILYFGDDEDFEEFEGDEE